VTGSDPEGEFPGPTFSGIVISEPGLSDDDWDAACDASGLALADIQREEINLALWWCAWWKQSHDVIPRMSEVKSRLRKFIRGVDQVLRAVGYLEACEISSVTERPPITTHVREGKAGRVWLALVLAATSDSWPHGYWTKRALGSIPNADDALSALHALGYTANRALEAWPDDKGGRQSGGDKHFIWRLLQILDRSGIDISYGQDRNTDWGMAQDGHQEPMSGPTWTLLTHIWSARPEVFVAKRVSTLGTYYRAAFTRLRNEPAKN
jgi:hypothetical protein